MNTVYMISLIMLVGTAAVYGGSNDTHVCCEGKIVKLEENSSMYCCGDEPYDSMKKGCCDRKTYNIELEACCGSTISNLPKANASFGCCYNEDTKENLAFDYKTSECCDGVVHATNGDSVCCAGKMENTAGGQDCCGDQKMFDTNKYICDYDNEAAEGEQFTLKSVSNNHSDVCDDKEYDTETHACCLNTIVPKDASLKNDRYVLCCQSLLDTNKAPTPYNYSTNICCPTGELMDISTYPKDAQLECCDGKIYPDNSSQLCCNNKVILLEEPYGGFCCGAEMMTHDNRTHMCCNDVAYLIEGEEGQGCCDGKPYNYMKQVCCNDVIHQNENGSSMGCCEETPYDLDTHLCCGENIKEKEYQDQQYCDSSKSFYNASAAICCGKATPLVNVDTAGCCYHYEGKETAFDMVKQRCDYYRGVIDIPVEEIARKEAMEKSEDEICRYN